MPSVSKEFKEGIAKYGQRYCHACDEIYTPPHDEHDRHEEDRRLRRAAVGLDPDGEGFEPMPSGNSETV